MQKQKQKRRKRKDGLLLPPSMMGETKQMEWKKVSCQAAYLCEPFDSYWLSSEEYLQRLNYVAMKSRISMQRLSQLPYRLVSWIAFIIAKMSAGPSFEQREELFFYFPKHVGKPKHLRSRARPRLPPHVVFILEKWYLAGYRKPNREQQEDIVEQVFAVHHYLLEKPQVYRWFYYRRNAKRLSVKQKNKQNLLPPANK